jgi:3-hydroxypropanoate dehydrogenase
MPANGAKILSAPVTVIVAMDTEFHEHLPWLFPHADAKAWFGGNDAARKIGAAQHHAAGGLLHRGRARAGAGYRADDRLFERSRRRGVLRRYSPSKSVMISTLGYGDPATIFDRSPRPDFDTFNRMA